MKRWTLGREIYFPMGFTSKSSIIKKEKVVLRDGTTYELTMMWTADPDFIVKNEYRNTDRQIYII